jgi:uncharacterized protein YndB with AHSA1/START domain
MVDPPKDRELSVTRLINAPPETVWRAWTERLAEWWCPRPWTSEVVEMDLRPGGRSAVIMSGPEGERHEHEGVYLEVIPEARIVFTDALQAGWHPAGPFMIAIIDMAPEGEGTRYTARVRHWSDGALERHKAMGFEEGWTIVTRQLAEIAEQMARDAPA